jgi:hypothetical protein
VVTRAFSNSIYARKFDEMVGANLPVPASHGPDAHGRADTQRKQRLFDWADALLKRFGLAKALARARLYPRVAPRHTQGNAWKTIVAMAFGLDGAKASTEHIARS